MLLGGQIECRGQRIPFNPAVMGRSHALTGYA
jgi:hypothetical protein